MIELDQYNRRIIKESDLLELLYKNPSFDFIDLYIDNPTVHNTAVDLNYSDLSKLSTMPTLDMPVEEYHKINQSTWHIPEEYKALDIASWILYECKGNQVELQRCGQELLEYAARDLLPLLQYLKYLVDLMTANNIVWGVGRGSSVASFVLYKIGIHKINSIEYQLPLEEFFKELLVN